MHWKVLLIRGEPSSARVSGRAQELHRRVIFRTSDFDLEGEMQMLLDFNGWPEKLA
jgi:hypothetical protein